MRENNPDLLKYTYAYIKSVFSRKKFDTLIVYSQILPFGFRVKDFHYSNQFYAKYFTRLVMNWHLEYYCIDQYTNKLLQSSLQRIIRNVDFKRPKRKHNQKFYLNSNYCTICILQSYLLNLIIVIINIVTPFLISFYEFSISLCS